MRILHLSNIVGEKRGGGVHEVVSNLYKHQKILNHTPHIWHPGYDSDVDFAKPDDNIRTLDTYGDAKHGVVKEIFQKITNNAKGFDIIHQHGIWTPMSLYAKKIKKSTGLKSVIQPHGYLEPYRLNISKYKKKIAFKLFEKSNLLGSSAIIACAEDEGLRLKNMFPNNDVAVIPNGVSEDFYNAESLRKSGKSKKNILFLSQIIPIKGLDRLFRVVSDIGVNNFSDWELLIAGYGDIHYINALKALAKELNISQLVKFVGTKFGNDKIEIFDNADVFILPTFNENFGIVVAESLARGIPVLTTKGTPWNELTTNKCGFWVDNSDDGIRDGLLQILSISENELLAMGKNGKRLVEDKYLWGKSAKSTIELYEWILTGNNKPNFII
jgi:glycosyltransferase involved in cell wall biosynthesis